MGATDWQITPATDWNYGLLVDEENPAESIVIEKEPISRFPYADAGDVLWSGENEKHITWEKDAPVILKVQGVQIPSWDLKDNSAADPPVSPVISDGDAVELELIPYGCAKLRITEFPVINR